MCERIVYRHGLYFAMAQYYSLCVSAVVSNLGGDDIEDEMPNREQVEKEREEVEKKERNRRERNKERPTNAQTQNITDGMRME